MEWNKEKRYTHWGVPIMLFMLLMYLFFLVLTIIFWVNELFNICLLITAVFFFGLLCVYNITIIIDNTYLSFKLGIGLIKKRYKIANIKSCKPVCGISKRIGIGTKIFFTGDILKYYIVTGFKAVELQFYDNKVTVHIGTPLSDTISQQIQLLIDENKNVQ